MRKIIAWITLTAFLFTSVPGVRAQPVSPAILAGGSAVLPVPGTMVNLSPAFHPQLLKGIKIYPKDPFRLDFILDRGDDSGVQGERGQQQMV